MCANFASLIYEIKYQTPQFRSVPNGEFVGVGRDKKVRALAECRGSPLIAVSDYFPCLLVKHESFRSPSATFLPAFDEL